MKKSLASQSVFRSTNPWLGVLFAGTFTLFALFMTIVATSVLTRDGIGAGPVTLLVIFWGAVVFLAWWTLHAALWAARYGRSTLRLDTTPLHLGDWVSGVVEVPLRDAAIIQLSVDCIRTTYQLSNQSVLLWQEIKLIDGTVLSHERGQMIVPFSVLLPTEGEPSADDRKNQRTLSWFLNVKADASVVNYETTFELAVNALRADGRIAQATPPRSMPELRADQLPAPRGVAERVGDAEVIRMPFPVVTFSLVCLFTFVALAAIAPGLPWSGEIDDDRFAVIAVSGFLAAMASLVLSLTCRGIEIRGEVVRIRRGLFGIGFHSTIAVEEIASIETRSPDPGESPAYYKVGFRTRKGGFIPAANRLKDEAEARSMVAALSEAILVRPR